MTGHARVGAAQLHCVACGGPNTAHIEVTSQAGGGGGQVHRVAAQSGDPCVYCGAPLVPHDLPAPAEARRCSNCAHSEAGSANFCRLCGAAMVRPDATTSGLGCAGCGGQNCSAWSAEYQGREQMLACGDCGGIWIGHTTLERLTSAAEENATGPGSVGRVPSVASRSLASGLARSAVVYRNCPECGQLMARRNFAQYSGIVLDSCPKHGVYFDAGELEGVLAFVRSGGLSLARRRQQAESSREAQQRLQLSASRDFQGVVGPQPSGSDQLAEAIVGLLDWGARWLRARSGK